MPLNIFVHAQTFLFLIKLPYLHLFLTFSPQNILPCQALHTPECFFLIPSTNSLHFFPGKILILSMKFFKFLPGRLKFAWKKTKESICLRRLTLSCCNKLALNWDFYFYGHWQILYNLVCWASATNVMIKLLLTVQYYESENIENNMDKFNFYLCVCVSSVLCICVIKIFNTKTMLRVMH